ncbi:hypothetical protein H0H93_012327, partial [Arthromyces matolae]
LVDLASSLHSYTQLEPEHNRPTLSINTSFATPFSIPPLTPYLEKYNEMHAWDRERLIHNPNLYAIWNGKPWLLDQAVRLLSSQGTDYDYAFWVDAGTFRESHSFRRWPDPKRVREVFSRKGGEDQQHDRGREDPVLIPLYGLPWLKEYGWRFEMGPVDADISEGSFFGSTPQGISWYSKTFYEAHNWYINTPPPPSSRHPHAAPSPSSSLASQHDDTKNNSNSSTMIPSSSSPLFHFVGKDQTVINTILFRYPSRFIGMLAPSRLPLLPPSPPPPPSPGPTQTLTRPKPYIFTLTSLFNHLSYLLTRVLSHKLNIRLKSQSGYECGDWYYYIFWLASLEERRLGKEAGWGGGGCVVGDEGWDASGERGWWRSEGVEVEQMLRGLFGDRWVESRRAG